MHKIEVLHRSQSVLRFHSLKKSPTQFFFFIIADYLPILPILKHTRDLVSSPGPSFTTS